MPPAKTRLRAANNENDENAAARVTRAKAAALIGDEVTVGAVKKALAQTKKTVGTTTTAANAQRKRTALADMSNVKRDGQEEGGKDAKKAGKPLAAKATNGISKPGRVPSVRQAPLGLKENKSKTSDTMKRPGGSNFGGPLKKRAPSSGNARIPAREEEINSENTLPANETEEVSDTKSAAKEEVSLKPVLEKPVLDDDLPDLDLEDADDPLMVSEYAVEIFEYLRELEKNNMPNANYMEFQDYLTWKKRDMLNDWLIEVHQKFQLLPETFYLAINIIDRFLSRKIVQLDKLQLVGITAMFIASKYEEVMSPHVSNFSWLAQEYSDEEILSAERFVLETLNYDLSYPNPMNFLRRISKADNYDMQTRTIGKYLLEISCLDHRFLQYPPSQVSAAAMYFARMMLDRGEWDRVITHYSGYTEEELAPVFHLMVDYVTSSKPKHEAFHTKYASRKYLKASLLVKSWAKRHFPDQPARQPVTADNVLGAADIKPRKSDF